MSKHELKTWPEFYEAIINGIKPFELRRDDRGFALDDVLWLREWCPEAREYTGRETARRVTFILSHRPDAGCAATFGLQPGYVVMATEWVPLGVVGGPKE